MSNLEYKRFYVKICAGPGSGGNPCIYHNMDFTFDLFMKYQWLFRYKAALYQVQNPKHHVHLSTGSYDYVPPTEMLIKSLNNKIISRKSIITQWQNKVKAWEAEWNQLFPITEQEFYIKAKLKIEKAILEYHQMIHQLNQLTPEA